jgi:hypothetical protein
MPEAVVRPTGRVALDAESSFFQSNEDTRGPEATTGTEVAVEDGGENLSESHSYTLGEEEVEALGDMDGLGDIEGEADTDDEAE